ncbi:cyclohexanone monooxygenase [Penicillium chermesinum]|uniref:Cyclohexanone monooxygenase n=1 Tax=Penicillium chermesinum TaxID=63820 RepID=A0A9W9TNE0_9EURO|nr:cyclohexanone monooxygenase [Penicillium chermesinum]KAJ5232915.1 cyclohexanone monooxygenase [Penicillium chermesinum]
MSQSPAITISYGPDLNAIPGEGFIHENSWYNQDFDGYRISEQPLFAKRHLRLICVGAGATGLQLAYKAERILENIDLQIYEKNDDIGGTWLENRYPGCACDIPSHSYQFRWARREAWSSFYSPSEEIWQYFKDISNRFKLEKYIKFNSVVESATWDEEEGKWNLQIKTPEGPIADSCDILISASGVLNSWKYPDIPGLEGFKGKLMHSANWDASLDLDGKNVAVIGGGSSGVQIIPSIQPQVKKLTAFLRSPVWVITGIGGVHSGPGGTNFKYSTEQIQRFKDHPEEYDQYCRDLEGELNKRFSLMHSLGADQKRSREAISKLMSERLGHDERLTSTMIPQFGLGCRRMTPGSGYLESLAKLNVEVINQSATRVTEEGIIDESGVEHKVDVIICATGFNTSFSPQFEIVGRNGANLKQQFGDFPVGYLAIMAANFPNLFLVMGPNGPVSHGSVLPIVEWMIRYIFQVVEKVQQENIKSFEPKIGAVKDLYNHTHEIMKRLVWSSKCSSWFKNGKKEGPVTAIYPGSRLHFFEMLKNVRWEDFELEYRSSNRFQFMGNGYTQCEIDPDGNKVWYFDDEFTQV